MKTQPGKYYPHYTLMVLVIVYVFNFIDRQIISILAEEIKADLGATDAQIGFLYGTAFAVFFAVFGIPLGRLADSWDRRKLISIGLGFWSLMTVLSGTARSVFSLGLYRIGVGIGEASATPASLSMLADHFSERVRATVMAIYYSGIYIGAGLGLMIGGLVVDRWDGAWPDPSLAPLGLRGWQVAYLAVGIPGLLMALWVWTLREPPRGAQDDIETPAMSAHPFREALAELLALLPVASWWAMRRANCPRRDFIVNLIGMAAIILVAALLIWATGSWAQWIALGIGFYATLCWMQTNRRAEPVGFSLMFHTPSYVLLVIGFSCVAFVTYGVGFWSPPFFIRVHGMSIAEAGNILGVMAAVGGGIGVVLGGVMGDLARRYSARGGLYVSVISVAVALMANLVMLTADDLRVALVANFCALLTSPMWIGNATNTVIGLVLPRLRALAAAFYILVITFIGLALGPYSIGLASRILNDGGMEAGEALRWANISGTMVGPIGMLLVLLASVYLAHDQSRMVQRARDMGETV